MADKTIIKILAENGLKATPQRIAILEVLLNLDVHPSADTIVQYLRLNYPTLSLGTIYRTLKIFTAKGIVKKALTENDLFRYDAVSQRHHHLYFSDTDEIVDYHDEELNKLLDGYFTKKKIQNFTITDLTLQITGTRK